MRVVIAFMAVFALVAAACSGDDAGDSTSSTTQAPGATSAPATPAPGATSAPATQAPGTTPAPAPDGIAGVEDLVVATTSLANLHLDPVAPIEFGVYKVNMALIYDWLIGSNPDGTLNKDTGLISDWRRDEAESKWVFTMREGITFSNGEPVNAEDAVFQIRRVMNPESGTGSAALFEAIVVDIAVVDAMTFTVTTPGPDITFPFFLSDHGLLEGLLAPSEYFQSGGSDLAAQKEAFLAAPIGSGPYKVVEAVAGSHVLLERNENYWRGMPAFKTIRVVEVAEEATRLAALQNGEAHIIEVARKDAPALANDGFVIHRKPGGATMGMVIHEQWVPDNPLSDIRVRQALNYAVDKELLLDTLFFGQGTLVDTWRVGSHTLGYEYMDPPAYDPALARQLLQDAGQEGMALTLVGFERQGLPEAREMMEALTSMMQEAGFDARLEWTEQGVLFETWFGYPDHPTESPMLARWGPTISMNNTGNQSFWQQNAKFVYLEDALALVRFDDEITALIAAADAAQVDADYIASTRGAQQWLRDNAVELPMFELDTLFASIPGITTDLWPQNGFQFSWNLEGLVVQS